MYADFECNLKLAESYKGSQPKKKYQDCIPCSFANNLACVDDKFTKPIVPFGGKNAAYEFNKAILKEYQYCKRVAKKHINKNLMSEEEEFLLSNTCWV